MEVSRRRTVRSLPLATPPKTDRDDPNPPLLLHPPLLVHISSTQQSCVVGRSTSFVNQ
jgi:hypothetical protein